MLTIKELKEYIKDLPDDMGIVRLHDDIYFSPNYSVGCVFGHKTYNCGEYKESGNPSDTKFLYII